MVDPLDSQDVSVRSNLERAEAEFAMYEAFVRNGDTGTIGYFETCTTSLKRFRPCCREWSSRCSTLRPVVQGRMQKLGRTASSGLTWQPHFKGSVQITRTLREDAISCAMKARAASCTSAR